MTQVTGRRAVRIANCSGFYGDRIAAAREMLGGPIDVLTGDYLAELTMLILWKARQGDPRLGYARTFLRQMEDVLGTCLDRGVKIVANAGGLNPAGLAAELRELAGRLGLDARIAHITGDDLVGQLPGLAERGVDLANLDTGLPLAKAGLPVVTANAYLGGWGIAAALAAGADVVVCPRVTDASLASGPAAWWHGWRRDDWDALAGAVLAGHVIECGPQATGGNYSFLDEIADRRHPGFPIAEIAADGSSVITKHDGTGGLVSVGTVTAQLLYEIAEPAYLGPDVITHFDTVRVEQAGPDRVALAGTRGSPPPRSLKVALNMLGGYRNTMTLVITGLDIEQKAEHARQLLFTRLGGTDAFDEADVRLLRFDRPDAPTNEQATAHLRITVKSQDERAVGRGFSDAALELALGGYSGFYATTPPTGGSAFGIYWPALVPAAEVTQTVHLPDGTSQAVAHTADMISATPAGATPAGVTPVGATPAGATPARATAANTGPPGATPARAAASPTPLGATLAASGPPAASPAGASVADVPLPTSGGRQSAIDHAAAPGEWRVAVPLGRLCGARSGDKGGNANVGFWARDDRTYAWLRAELTVDRLRELLTEAADLEIRRFELPNLRALNFVIIGLIAPGVAATTRPDAQAKGLGEYLRSRYVLVPAELVPQAPGGH
ncbi:MAG TPA: acyclic terpene utilization AtuA family protein [Streptosporangiaceae bacterium]